MASIESVTLEVPDPTAAGKFYAAAFGLDKHVYGRRALAKDAGVSPEGSGSHRLIIESDAGSFTDPDGFLWRPQRPVAEEQWLTATWPFVREHLPAPPARVVELGCGPLGGFVPRMRALGYDAVGVDPDAPAGAEYERIEFEHRRPGPLLDAVVACTSLHHVADLDLALDRISSQLKPAGSVVVVEWAHEQFDEPTARWCFDRLSADDDHENWLYAHHDHWQRSGQPWEAYFRGWIAEERLHTGRAIMRALQTRFETRAMSAGPLFFADLDDVTEDEEQSAIDAGLIQANALHFVGQR